MTHDDRNLDFDNALDSMRAVPGPKDIEQAGARVWSRLQNTEIVTDVEINGCADVRRLLPAFAAGELTQSRALLVKDHLHECVACREVANRGQLHQVVWEMPKAARSRWSIPQMAMVAAAILAVVAGSVFLGSYLQSPSGMRAKVQSVKGTLYLVSDKGDRAITPGTEIGEGQLVRTSDGSHAFIQLRDGSTVEMSERSEFSVKLTRWNTTVHLDQGRIIVQAAHRSTGHLYVKTPDANVAVTGTIFSVNTGMKGSRVAVVQGAVHVAYSDTETLLHAGDEANTTANLTTVPVEEEIAWSDNLDNYVALLLEFKKLQTKFEQIPTPGLRYSSPILGKLPSNTVFFASVPNLGEALNEANKIFQNELQQSGVLRAWWNNGHKDTGGVTFDQMITKLHGLSQFIGDEIVIAGFAGRIGGEDSAVIIAPVKAPGLQSFLQAEFTNLPSGTGTTDGLRILTPEQLASATDSTRQMTALVGEQYVMFSSSTASLRNMNAQFSSGLPGLDQTTFGQRLANVYTRGVGLLFAADLHSIIANAQNTQTDAKHQAAMFSTGFSDADYLIVQHRDLSGTPDNRAVLSFSGPRHGIASWLAAPNPTGSLEFVSANAATAVSFLTKTPAAMFDDLFQMISADKTDAQQHLADTNAKLNLDIRNDIAGALGGDVAFALDGPVLPTPAWKVVVQVYDSTRLQGSVEKLVQAMNAELAEHGKPGIQLKSSTDGDRVFYTLASTNGAGLPMEIDYTYSDGYLIAAPSKALVQTALQTKANGDSLARSSAFLSLLPKDQNMNFSGVLYQNLGPVLQPLAAQLNQQQVQALQQLAADSKPTVICAYAGNDRIEIASGSRLLPFDLNSIGIATLLGQRQGTSKTQ